MIIKKLIKIKINKLDIIASHLKNRCINEEFIRKIKINKHILNKKFKISDQIKYINNINASDNNLILSLKLNKKFVGTIGFQDLDKKFSKLGIFIFSKLVLKKKLSKYFLIAGILLVNYIFKKKYFLSGIHNSNIISIKSFASVGFLKIKNSQLKYLSKKDYNCWITKFHNNYSCYKLDIKDLKNICRFLKVRPLYKI
jgi:hypothetical protein